MTYALAVDSSIDNKSWQQPKVTVEPLRGKSRARRISSGYKVAMSETVAQNPNLQSASGTAASFSAIQAAQGLEPSTGCSIKESAYAEEHLF